MAINAHKYFRFSVHRMNDERTKDESVKLKNVFLDNSIANSPVVQKLEISFFCFILSSHSHWIPSSIAM